CFPSVLNVPGKIDLALVITPAKIVPLVMRECAEKKIPSAIIISAGFAETGDEGRKLQEEVAEIARKGRMRLLGPNTLGVIRPSMDLNASFAPSMPPEGRIAFIFQSGALADSVIDRAIKEEEGFSALVGLGNKSDLDETDFIRFFSEDKETKVIALYLEGIERGRRLMQVARKCRKPIIMLKGGRTKEGGEATASHTGHLAGDYNVLKGAMKQCRVLLVDSLEELFDLAKVFEEQPLLKKNGIAIVSNGGGAGVLCTDYCKEFGLNLVPLKEETLKKLDKHMHHAYSRRNPLDIVGDALPERYKAAIEALLAEDYVYGLIVIQTLQTMTKPEENAKTVVEAHKKFPSKPIVCAFMGGQFSEPGMKYLESRGIPDFQDPKRAAMAMAALAGLL
ncbi:CoA-binding protein, partial [Candidatus Micrarchaeota archaeon]|nr:CoA-binding protein [Candidatus Micrarchaeota archaeon]